MKAAHPALEHEGVVHGFVPEGSSSAPCQQCYLGQITWPFLCVLSFSFLYVYFLDSFCC